MSVNNTKKFEFSLLPTDVKGGILTFLIRDRNVAGVVRQILTLMDKGDREIFDSKIQEYRLYRKYRKYNFEHDEACERFNALTAPSFSLSGLDTDTLAENQKFLQRFRPSRYPQLLDALSSGCRLPCVERSIEEYTPAVEQDIYDTVRLMPDSLHCRFGRLRLRGGVSPLAMACMNPNVPIQMVKWLLEQGANPNDTWDRDGGVTSIEESMVDYLRKYPSSFFEDRRSALLKLFAEFQPREEKKQAQTTTTTSSTTTSS